MNIIDARGLSCPQPVILVKQALDKDSTGCQIVVDNRVAVENITRFSSHNGYQVHTKNQDGDFHLTITKS